MHAHANTYFKLKACHPFTTPLTKPVLYMAAAVAQGNELKLHSPLPTTGGRQLHGNVILDDKRKKRMDSMFYDSDI